MTKSEKARSCAETPLAKMLAPEDVRAGDYVTLLHVVHELPSFFWNTDATLLRPDELVRVRSLPTDGGTPLRVRSICLPFLLVESATGESRTLDLRRLSIARLERSFAKKTWKALKKASLTIKPRTPGTD